MFQLSDHSCMFYTAWHARNCSLLYWGVNIGILQEVLTCITLDLLFWYPNTFCISPLLGYPSPPPYNPDGGGEESTASSWVSMIVHFVQPSSLALLGPGAARPWCCSGLRHPDCLSNFCKGSLFGVELGEGCGWCNELSARGQLFFPTTITVSVTELLVDFLFGHVGVPLQIQRDLL